jgi:hypothetical protein
MGLALFLTTSCTAMLSRRAFSTMPFAAPLTLGDPQRASAAMAFPGRMTLGDRLAQSKPELLVKPIFNTPPGVTSYPGWLVGTWDVAQVFDGFVFPSKRISREQIMREPAIPGLQKLSVVSVPDMGKSPCSFQMRFVPGAGGRAVEDKRFNIASAVDGCLEAKLVQKVEYEPERNPNRCSVVMRPGRTRNAERIELFFNARESEALSEVTFVASEHLRQVTFSASPAEGIVRQVSGSYGQYQTFTRMGDSSGQVRLNLLTAAYLEPTEQEALYFDSVDQPVLVYSHEAILRPAPARGELVTKLV